MLSSCAAEIIMFPSSWHGFRMRALASSALGFGQMNGTMRVAHRFSIRAITANQSASSSFSPGTEEKELGEARPACPARRQRPPRKGRFFLPIWVALLSFLRRKGGGVLLCCWPSGTHHSFRATSQARFAWAAWPDARRLHLLQNDSLRACIFFFQI